MCLSHDNFRLAFQLGGRKIIELHFMWSKSLGFSFLSLFFWQKLQGCENCLASIVKIRVKPVMAHRGTFGVSCLPAQLDYEWANCQGNFEMFLWWLLILTSLSWKISNTSFSGTRGVKRKATGEIFISTKDFFFYKINKKMTLSWKKRGIYLLLLAERTRYHSEASKKSVFSVN